MINLARAMNARHLILLPTAATSLLLIGCKDIQLDTPPHGVYRVVVWRDGKLSTGTAFQVTPTQVVTNLHVVDRKDAGPAANREFDQIYIVSQKGDAPHTTRARLTSRSDTRDLALLTVEERLPGNPIPLADYDPLESTEVKAIGYPAAADIAAATKIDEEIAIEQARYRERERQLKTISLTPDARKRELDTQLAASLRRINEVYERELRSNPNLNEPTRTDGKVSRMNVLRDVRTIQHQAFTYPGSSGGPLLDACGVAVGVNTSKGERQDAINFAVSSRELIAFLRQEGATQTDTRATTCVYPLLDRYLPYLAAGLALLVATVAAVAVRRRPSRSTTTGSRQSRATPATPKAHGAAADTLVEQRKADPATTVRLLPISAPTPPLLLALDSLQGAHGLVLGRAPTSDIVINDPSVSKAHARLTVDAAGRLTVQDLDSSNGTWEGTTRIKNDHLASGATIRFGNAEYRVELPALAVAAASAAPVAAPAPRSAPDRAEPVPRQFEPRARRMLALAFSGFDEAGRAIQITFRPESDHSRAEWTIGRKPERVDRAVQHTTVSSEHALVRYTPGLGMEIRDLNSSNGTYVDGARVGADFVTLEGVRKVILGGIEMTVSRA